jgi:hypothetical protein
LRESETHLLKLVIDRILGRKVEVTKEFLQDVICQFAGELALQLKKDAHSDTKRTVAPWQAAFSKSALT